VIICGHSHCGAMKGLLKVESLRTEMPLVYEWLEHAEATRRLIKENYSDHEGEELLDITIAENVLTQIENLKTYPVVRSKLHQGKMQIYGWIYEIESGEVLAYDPVSEEFVSPQSHLAMYENLPAPVPGRYTQTSAPPTDPDTSHNSGWLSAAQIDRIYRGTGK
ncbi:MAG: carbonic anhydrase, partial [Pseudanabaenaceae cyanobacterium]